MKTNNSEPIISGRNVWVFAAMGFFFVTKVTALLCATYIAVKGNIWMGAALFIAAILFRITWTYVPSQEVSFDDQEIVDIAQGLRNAIGRLQERRENISDLERRKQFTDVEERIGKTYNRFSKIALKRGIELGRDDPQ